MVFDFGALLATPLGTVFVGLIGLVVGSFLNVVITRLPMMVERDERHFSLSQLNIEPPVATPLNLAWPRSFCPKCLATIRWHHNIPLLSWLMLRGRCGNCDAPISVRYPLVEAISALLLILLFASYGPTLEFCFKAFFCLGLVAVAYMDWETGWLPDAATIPLIGAGLLFSVFMVAQPDALSPVDAIIGAVTGYGLFWLLNFVYRSLTGRNGLGYGDFKLVAALGAWLGWVLLPLNLLFAALIAFAFGIYMIRVGTYQRDVGIRFAPFLSVVGIGLLLGRDIGLVPSYLGG